MSPAELGTKNDRAAEDQQQFTQPTTSFLKAICVPNLASDHIMLTKGNKTILMIQNCGQNSSEGSVF
jgi:hypothetical protein